MTRKLLLLPLAAAAAAAAIAANILLLGRAAAGNEPTVRLSPRAHLPAAPNWTVRPTTGHPQDGGADD